MPPQGRRPDWTVVDFVHTGHFWQHRGILLLNLCLLLPLLTAWTNGYDGSLVNGLQIIPDWQKYFHNPNGKALGLISAAHNFGTLAGFPITPFSNDIFGRRATLFIGSLIMAGGIAIQACSTTVPMFIGARVIVGFGLSFALAASPLLITELAYPTQRGKVSSMYNACWYTGSVISAWACFGAYDLERGNSWTWRVPTLIQAAAPITQLCAIWFVPESPRWLVSKGMEGKAAAILAKYHSNSGDEHDPLVVFEMAQIRYALRMEKEFAERTTLATLWSTPGNRKRVRIIIAIAAFSQWSGNGLVSYYIHPVLEGIGITSAFTQAEINGGLQCFNFLCAMAGAMLVDRLGRRTLFIISNIGMLAVFSMWTLTTALFKATDNANAAKATVPLIFLFFLAYDICYSPMLVSYTLEILPYNIRAKGFALMNVTVGLFVSFNQFVNPVALEALGWKYYIFYCCFLVFELVFVLRYIVETKGRTLEETAALFDGPQPELDLVQQGGEAATMTMQQLQSSTMPRFQLSEIKTDESFPPTFANPNLDDYSRDFSAEADGDADADVDSRKSGDVSETTRSKPRLFSDSDSDIVMGRAV